MFNQANRRISRQMASRPLMNERLLNRISNAAPAFATATPDSDMHERLLGSAYKALDHNANEHQYYSNLTFAIRPSKNSLSVKPTNHGVKQEKFDDKATSEPWKNNRRWLGMIFATWFLIAFGLLINAIYAI